MHAFLRLLVLLAATIPPPRLCVTASVSRGCLRIGSLHRWQLLVVDARGAQSLVWLRYMYLMSCLLFSSPLDSGPLQ